MNASELLTAAQLGKMFGYSASSIKTNFKKTLQAIKKKNTNIKHIYRVKAEDGQIYYSIDEEERALTIYQEKRDIRINIKSLSLKEYQFLIFLAIVVSEHNVYRGTHQQLLKYLGAQVNKKNCDLIDRAIASLKKKGCILDVDTYDKEYFTLILKTDIQEQYSVRISMLKQCRKIVQENNKQFKKLPQLVQVWEAIRICEQHQPFTYAELQNMTGLSYYQIREVKKLLETNDIFISNRAGSYWKCLGMNVDLNVFYDNDLNEDK